MQFVVSLEQILLSSGILFGMYLVIDETSPEWMRKSTGILLGGAILFSIWFGK
jgi:hypothetical protein